MQYHPFNTRKALQLRSIRRKSLLLLLLLATSLHLISADCTFVIVGTGSWSNPANWDCVIVPGASDNITINSSSTVQVNSNITVNSLTLNGGVIIETGLGGSITATSVITDGGTLNLPVTVTSQLNILDNPPAPSAILQIAEDLTINGNTTFSGGSINLSGGDLINNGIFDSAADGTINYNLLNPGSFINNNTFRKTGGTSLGINCPFSNPSGSTIDVQTGTTSFNRSLTNTGTINILGMVVIDGASTSTFNSNTQVTGNGILDIKSDINMFGPGIPCAAHVKINGGFLRQSGTLQIQNQMDWISGQIQNIVQIMSGGTMNIDIVSSETINDGTLINDGTIEWNSGGISLIGSQIQNNQLLNVNGNTLISGGILPNMVVNSGMVITTSNVMLTISEPFNNSGTLGGIGHFNITGSFVNSGTISPGQSPGVLTFNQNLTLGAGGLFIEVLDNSGPGTGHSQLIGTGTISLSGELNVIETGLVSNASFIIAECNAGANCLTGTFTTTSLPAGYTIAYSGTSAVISKSVLPVTWKSFEAQNIHGSIKLNWSTESEIQNNGFEIMHSRHANDWTKLGFVMGHGTSQTTHEYSFIHNSPKEGQHYYQLRQIDFDGNVELSKIIAVHHKESHPSILIYPNPTRSFITIDLISLDHLNDILVNIELFDASGKSISTNQRIILNDKIQLDVNRLPSGYYHVLIKSSEHIVTSNFLIE